MDFFDSVENLPPLETNRLILRRVLPTDAEAIFSYASRPEVTANLTWRTHRSLEDTYLFIQGLQCGYAEGTAADWGIVCKADGRFVGTIGMAHVSRIHGYGEVGYVLHPDYWGRGIVTEALGAIIDFSFAHGLNRVEAVHAVENPASGRVMEKAGMQYEGILRQRYSIQGQYRDMKMYSILREEWEYANADNGRK